MIVANYTDNIYALANCSVVVDGVANQFNLSTINASSTTMTLSTLSEGAHTYYFNCTDGSGNSGTSTTNTLTADTVAPKVTGFTAPSAGAITTLTNIESRPRRARSLATLR